MEKELACLPASLPPSGNFVEKRQAVYIVRDGHQEWLPYHGLNWNASASILSTKSDLSSHSEQETSMTDFANPRQSIRALPGRKQNSCCECQSKLVMWDANDPKNPQNFSAKRRWLMVLILAVLNFSVSLAIGLFGGVATAMAKDFNVDPSALQLGTVMYGLGVAFGPVIFGPASEFYGRNRPLIVGMLGFCVFSLWETSTSSLRVVFACRFATGVCGSAAFVIPPGSFVDIYGNIGRAVGYALFACAAFVGSSLGPGLGALIVTQSLDWRWIVWITVCLVALPTLGLMLMPETLAGRILSERARSLRIETGIWSYHCRQDETRKRFRDFLVKPVRIFVREPVLILITFSFTVNFGIQALSYTAIPIAFESKRRWSAEAANWALAPTIAGFIIGSILVILDTCLRYRKNTVCGQVVPPESRLPPMIFGVATLATGLIWFGWTSSANVNAVWPILAEVVLGCGMFMFWVIGTIYVQDVYLEHSNSALAASSFVRYLVGSTFPLFSGPLYDTLGVAWTMTLIGLVLFLLVPFYVLFYFFGRSIRARSSFAP